MAKSSLERGSLSASCPQEGEPAFGLAWENVKVKAKRQRLRMTSIISKRTQKAMTFSYIHKICYAGKQTPMTRAWNITSRYGSVSSSPLSRIVLMKIAVGIRTSSQVVGEGGGKL